MGPHKRYGQVCRPPKETPAWLAVLSAAVTVGLLAFIGTIIVLSI